MPTPNSTSLARALIARDRWAAAAGAKLVEVRCGYARARLRLAPVHLNGVGVAQGGAVFTLADFAFAAASNSHGSVAVALDTSMTFVRATVRGVLTAEAREESVSRRVSVCTVRVTDASGRLVALFRGTAFRKEEPIQLSRSAARKTPRRGSSGKSARATRSMRS
ncbi:MAG TPA: PaaI family thioesterase [Myxococcales bacterium]